MLTVINSQYNYATALKAKLQGWYHAKFTKKCKCAHFAAVAVAMLFMGFFSQALVGSAQSVSVNTEQILVLTNEQRSQHGLPVLNLDPKLTELANKKSQDMLDRQYFAHEDPSKKWIWDYAGTVNYDYLYFGENLSEGYMDAKSIVNAWMNSELHKENILRENYTDIGIGIAEGQYMGKDTLMVTQIFGRKKMDVSQLNLAK